MRSARFRVPSWFVMLAIALGYLGMVPAEASADCSELACFAEYGGSSIETDEDEDDVGPISNVELGEDGSVESWTCNYDDGTKLNISCQTPIAS